MLSGELVLGNLKLSLGIVSLGGQVVSLFGELKKEGFEVELLLGLVLLVVKDGLFEGSSQFSDLVLNGLESLWGEGGGELNEGKDGVFTTDSLQFSEDGISVSLWLDGSELGGNNVEGFDDLRSGELSLFEVSVVLGSGVSQDLFLFVEDVKLNGGVLDGGFEAVNLVGKRLDLVAGFSDFVGGVVDSSVVSGDFSVTFSFVGSVLDVSILLLQDEVLSQVLEHSGDVRKGSLVLHLEGDGVKELLSHQAVLKGFELGVDGHVGV